MSNLDIPDFKTSLNFVVIDLETTGLDPVRDEIIEIAAIKFAKGIEVSKFSTLTKPKQGVPKFIEYLTHINPSELANAPEVGEVLEPLRSYIGNDVVVGHNVNFDLGFLNQALAKTGSSPVVANHWDTAEISRVYLPFTSDHKLSTLTSFFNIDLQDAHRAEADARATGLLLIALSEYAIRHFPLLVNARLLDFSRQAKLDNTLYHYLHRLVEHQRKYALVGSKPKIPRIAPNNLIEHEVEAKPDLSIDDVFSNGGLLSRCFPNYEFRLGQQDMASKVKECFKSELHLAVEAGTGVGKSFAYLVPAIAFSCLHQTKVVVSTNTKNLQEQLFFKDLPQLTEMLPIPFKATLVKGRENYICERRWEDLLLEQTRGASPYEASALLNLFIWKYLTKTGDVSENSSFDRTRFGIAWRRVCSDRYTCSGRKCPHAGRCYVQTLRKQIESSTVVVTNHSLLLADLRMEGSTLGEYKHLIVDEAHNLMSTAAKNLGFELGHLDINSFLNQLSVSYKRKNTGFLHQLAQAIVKSLVPDSGKEHVTSISETLTKNILSVRKAALDLFNQATSQCADSSSFGKLRIKAMSDVPALEGLVHTLVLTWKDMLKDLYALNNVLTSFNPKLVPGYDLLSETLVSYVNRATETEAQLLTLENPDLDFNAMWIEAATRPESKNPAATFCYAPIDVSTQLNKMLYEVVPSIVFTSATLSIRGSFKFFFAQSGLSLVPDDHIRTAIVESPFDYDKQSRLLIASFLPEPKDKYFMNQALGCVEQIVSTTDVGTMILFTSYKDLNGVYDHLGDMLYRLQRPFFAQGKAVSRNSMLDEFKKHTNAILLGTNSFWEGVDVQGDSLSLLILFKLPFLVPSEPLVEALIDKLDRENKDSFMHYMLPNALLKLRQGFGRLIRSKTDRGVVLIMDSRVSHKKYGDYFKQVLPTQCLELRNEMELISEISKFFSKVTAN